MQQGLEEVFRLPLGLVVDLLNATLLIGYSNKSFLDWDRWNRNL